MTIIQKNEKIILRITASRKPTALKITPTNLKIRKTPPIINIRKIAPKKLNIAITSLLFRKIKLTMSSM